MCDYSLEAMRSRPAKIGDKLAIQAFGTGIKGFAAPEDSRVVVCVAPGTELVFDADVQIATHWWHSRLVGHKTAIFRQINKERVCAHHDALEFPSGQVVLLTFLCEGQQATVLQLPAEPKIASDLVRAEASDLLGLRVLK